MQGVVARRTFWKFKIHKAHNCRTTFGSCDVEKSASRFWRESTFVNEQLKNNLMFGPFLEVEMSKKCTALWREAHFDFKMLKYQIFRFAEMILRHRCSISYDLASLFGGRRSKFDKWTGKISKDIGTRPSALHAIFLFWRNSRRIASFLMLLTLKSEEISQNCFVFDVVKLTCWGNLAELFSFFDIINFWKNDEASQSCFRFLKFFKLKYWGSLAE